MCRPFKEKFVGGNKYFILFVDGCNKNIWIYSIQSNNEVFDIFKKLKVLVEKTSCRRIKVLRNGGGDEYVSLRGCNLGLG